MSCRGIGARATLGVFVLLVSMAFTTVGSWAAGGVKLCVPKAEGSALLTPKHGKCRRGYKLTSLGAEGKEGKAGKAGPEGKEGRAGPEGKAGTAGLTATELEALRSILPHIAYVGFGIGGKPTVQFSGVNVQLLDGAGKTEAINGTGNLVVGYDESPGAQTGSHNIILGRRQTFTSYGGLLVGQENVASGEDVVVFGAENEASGSRATVTGGFSNKASGDGSSVSGGDVNKATTHVASVQGGTENVAEADKSSIFGGKGLIATKEFEAIP